MATRTYNLIPSPIRSVRDPSEVKQKEKNRAAEVKKEARFPILKWGSV